MLGRVSSLDFFVSLALMPISMALAGPVGEAIGYGWTFLDRRRRPGPPRGRGDPHRPHAARRDRAPARHRHPEDEQAGPSSSRSARDRRQRADRRGCGPTSRRPASPSTGSTRSGGAPPRRHSVGATGFRPSARLAGKDDAAATLARLFVLGESVALRRRGCRAARLGVPVPSTSRCSRSPGTSSARSSTSVRTGTSTRAAPANGGSRATSASCNRPRAPRRPRARGRRRLGDPQRPAAARPCRLGARPRNRMRHPGPARPAVGAAGRRDRHLGTRPHVRPAQRRAERCRRHRVPAGQHVRARRGRALRPHRVESAVRDHPARPERARLRVPGRRPRGRRSRRGFVAGARDTWCPGASRSCSATGSTAPRRRDAGDGLERAAGWADAAGPRILDHRARATRPRELCRDLDPRRRNAPGHSRVRAALPRLARRLRPPRRHRGRLRLRAAARSAASPGSSPRRAARRPDRGGRRRTRRALLRGARGSRPGGAARPTARCSPRASPWPATSPRSAATGRASRTPR